MVAITVTKEHLETLTTRIALSGLTAGDRYDVHRLQYRYLGKDNTGVRQYERELPDRRGLWSSVGHRVGWEAPATTATFRDFEAPRRPTKYFVVATDDTSPHEWDFAVGDYPLGTGALSAELVHFNGDLEDLLAGEPDVGHILVRSTNDLALYADACLVEMDGPTYTARANEFAVMGNQYPVIVSDSREARRGSVTLMIRNLGQYNALRRIVFPESGKIRPFILNSGGDAALLLDDMRCVPLDVEIEQTTPANVDYRYVTIDYVEVDPSAPLLVRAGDNDTLVSEPNANFTISDTTPARDQWVKLTDTSTGLGDTWEWTVDGTHNNKVGKFYTEGPHWIQFKAPGTKTVKLRFGGSGAGYNSRVKTLVVH